MRYGGSVPTKDSPPSRQARAFSVQAKLLFLLLLVLVPILIVESAIYYDRLQGRYQLQREANYRVARSAAEHFNSLINRVLDQQLTAGVALTCAPDPASEPVRTILETVKTGNSAIRDLAWVSAQGQVAASTRQEAVGLNIGDRPYFQEIVAGQEWTLSDLLIPRITGRPAFVISRGIRNSQGRLCGIMVAVMALDRIQSLLPLDPKTESSLVILDRAGRAVYSHPAAELAWGERHRLSIPAEFQEVSRSSEPFLMSCSSARAGSTHMIALLPVRSTGWVVGASRPEWKAMAPDCLRLLRHAGLFGLVSFSAFLTALYIARRINRPIVKLRNYALRLGEGSPEDPVELQGPLELRDLAFAINTMAERIHAREQELLAMKNQLEENVRKRTIELTQALRGMEAEVVQRTTAEGALRFERQRLESLLNNLPAFVFLVNSQYSIEFTNRYFVEHFGDVKGQQCYEANLGAQVPCESCPALKVFNTKHPRTWEWTHADSGKTFQVYGYPFLDGDGLPLVLALGMDITERKHAEKALQESEKQLRFLSSEILKTQEDERRRIAGELHDSIGSSLSAIKIYLETMLQQMERGTASPDTVRHIMTIVQDTMKEARRIITDLRPSILDDFGIVKTIQWFCREFQTIHSTISLEVNLAVKEEQIPDSLKIIIFRIMQEAFHNIVKHSRAEQVILSLMEKDGALELLIEDNGDGFDVQGVYTRSRTSRGLGLMSMKERAELSGGHFNLESIPGERTTIRASWPLPGSHLST